MKKLLLAFALIGFIATSSFASSTVVKTSSEIEFCDDDKDCDKKDCKHDKKAKGKKSCCSDKTASKDKKSCCANKTTASKGKSCHGSKASADKKADKDKK